MKALGVSDRLGLQRYVSQQIYYSLEALDAEYELVPLAVDQECSILVWSPKGVGATGVLTPVRARSLARESLERLGKVVHVGEPTLGGDLPHGEAGVVEQVLGALYAQVQQELVWGPPEAVAEDLREP